MGRGWKTGGNRLRRVCPILRLSPKRFHRTFNENTVVNGW